MKNLICLILTLSLLLAALGGCSNPAESGDLSTVGGSGSEESESEENENIKPVFTFSQGGVQKDFAANFPSECVFDGTCFSLNGEKFADVLFFAENSGERVLSILSLDTIVLNEITFYYSTYETSLTVNIGEDDQRMGKFNIHEYYLFSPDGYWFFRFYEPYENSDFTKEAFEEILSSFSTEDN